MIYEGQVCNQIPWSQHNYGGNWSDTFISYLRLKAAKIRTGIPKSSSMPNRLRFLVREAQIYLISELVGTG